MYTITSEPYWLVNAAIPNYLVSGVESPQATWENLAIFHLHIRAGQIVNVTDQIPIDPGIPLIDLQNGIVLPCFVDVHTHLDKGHIWTRSPNPDGTFAGAITASVSDYKFWQPQDLYRRIEFGLKCSYVHGTKAIRTHLDLPPRQREISLAVFAELKKAWRDRLTLQAAALVNLDQWFEKSGEDLADRLGDLGGTIGGIAIQNPGLETQLDRVFALAKERHLDLDFHTDENDDLDSQTLLAVAEAALRHDFLGKIVCGHCCNLSLLDEDSSDRLIEKVREAKLQIVSLPACNLYLQDRHLSQTPRWRGVTLLHELKASGVPVAIAHDNARDPFYGFGDHDLLEVFRMAVQIAHLDMPYGDWLSTITQTPAQIMGLVCQIAVGTAADLVIFKARNFSELLSRPQSDRLVIRKGKAIDTSLPDYSELDDLLQ